MTQLLDLILRVGTQDFLLKRHMYVTGLLKSSIISLLRLAALKSIIPGKKFVWGITHDPQQNG
jgi:hypothetical protein